MEMTRSKEWIFSIEHGESFHRYVNVYQRVPEELDGYLTVLPSLGNGATIPFYDLNSD